MRGDLLLARQAFLEERVKGVVSLEEQRLFFLLHYVGVLLVVHR
jgi:hypothetical protein